MRRIAIAVLALLGLCGAAKGQCIVTLSGVVDNPTFSGSAYLGGYTISGAGNGLYGGSTQKSHSGLNFASTSITGDFTEIYEVTGVGSATGAGGGISAMEYGTYNNLTSTNKAFTFGVVLNAGNYDLVIQSVTELSSSRWSGGLTIYNQPVTYSLPFYIEISRSGNTYTFSQSQNGSSYSTVTTATSVGSSKDPTLVGLVAWSGNTTSGQYGTITGQNFSVNSGVPVLSDADYWTTGGNAGSEGPQVQAGTLDDGPYSAAGGITLANCSYNQQASLTQSTSLYNVNTSTYVFQYQFIGSFEQCLTTCLPVSSTVALPGNLPLSATLVHGDVYHLILEDQAVYGVVGNYTQSNAVTRTIILQP